MTTEHPDPLATAQRRATLEAFARALDREAHPGRPYPLGQCLRR